MLIGSPVLLTDDIVNDIHGQNTTHVAYETNNYFLCHSKDHINSMKLFAVIATVED